MQYGKHYFSYIWPKRIMYRNIPDASFLFSMIVYIHLRFLKLAVYTRSCLFSCLVPTAPALLSVIASGPGNLTVTWEEPSSTNGEIINYKISIINDGAIVIEGSGIGTEFVVTELEPFTDYFVRVQACTIEGCGPFSNEIMNTTLQEGSYVQ